MRIYYINNIVSLFSQNPLIWNTKTQSQKEQKSWKVAVESLLQRVKIAAWILMSDVCVIIIVTYFSVFDLGRTKPPVRRAFEMEQSEGVMFVLFILIIMSLYKMTYLFFSFTLYPAYSRVGREIIVLRHSVNHFPPHFRSVSCWDFKQKLIKHVVNRCKSQILCQQSKYKWY